MIEGMETTAPAPRETRGRKPRAAAVSQVRRRRSAGSLNRLAQMRLDFIEPEYLDLENYTYRWINDDGGRLRMFTRMDDYDFVTGEDLGEGFDEKAFDNESDGRLRIQVDVKKGGQPLYAYLCKKPKAFWEADYDENVKSREAMMASRVYQADGLGSGGEDDRSVENPYVPSEVKLGHTGERRKGPIPRRVK